MLSSDRRKFLITLGVLPLAACGFTPVYKEGAAARGLMGQIRFNLIESREGFLMLERLENRLGAPSANSRYAAEIVLEIEEVVLTLTAATSLERITVNGTATLKVKDIATGEEVFSDKLRETTGYSSSSETAVSVSVKRDAHERLVLSLADKIVSRLSSTANSWAT